MNIYYYILFMDTLSIAIELWHTLPVMGKNKYIAMFINTAIRWRIQRFVRGGGAKFGAPLPKESCHVCAFLAQNQSFGARTMAMLDCECMSL